MRRAALVGVLVFSSCGGAAPSALESRLVSEPPEAFAGILHTSGRGATNLVLEAGGRFRWTHCGCDFLPSGRGRWVVSGERVTLLPEEGRPTFQWFMPRAVGPLDRVELSQREPGTIIAVGSEPIFGGFTQQWERGRLCARCQPGLLFPESTYVCAGPLPEQPCSGQ